MLLQCGVAAAPVGVGSSILGIEFYAFVKILERQHADVQIFLLRTSILERFCELLYKVVVGVDTIKEKFILDHLDRASLPTNRGNLLTKAVQ